MGVELLLRDLSGRELASVIVQLPTADGSIGLCMNPSPATPGVGTDASKAGHVQVLGRIEARKSDLLEAIEDCLKHMLATGCVEGSAASFRRIWMAAIRDEGWSSCDDMTYENIVGYLDRKKLELGWMGSTYNGKLSAFRTLTRYLKRRRRLAENALEDVDRADEHEHEDCRAATLEEARAMIRYPWLRQASGDNRCEGNRALHRLCLFGHGMRPNEPQKLCWRHMLLEESIPAILWTPEIQKNKRREEVPLGKELAVLLLRHRETVPHGSNDPVFPVCPSKTTWRTDRDACQIAPKIRDMAFAPRSARRFFKTWMLNNGVDDAIVRRLMRHAPNAGQRYYDPTSAELLQAVEKIPGLWPEALFISDLQTGGPKVENSTPEMADLTPAQVPGHDVAATPMTNSSPNSVRSPRLAAPSESHLGGQTRRADPPEFSPVSTPASKFGPGVSAAESSNLRSRNGHFGTENEGLNTAIARLLNCVADVLLEGAARGRKNRRSA